MLDTAVRGKSGFKYAYMPGAVCPARDEAVGLVLPTANTDAMLIHLEHITEQVWQILRDTYLANRCYEGYDDIVKACCDAWNRWVDIPESVKKLCSRSWIDL